LLSVVALALALWAVPPALAPQFAILDRAAIAWADDDDGPSGSPGGEGGGPSAGGSGGGVRSGAARFGSNPLSFWQSNRPRRPLFGQRAVRVQQVRRARAPVRSRAAVRTAVPRAPTPAPAAPARAREFVVWAADDAAPAAIEAAGFRIVARGALSLAAGEVLRVRAPVGLGRTTAIRRLTAAAPGATVAPNDLYGTFLRPSGMRRNEPGKMLDHAIACAAGATMAMIDTGVDRAHPALSSAAVSALTMRAADRKASSAAHGTAVASMLVGRRDGPAPGLAPAARLIAVDAFHGAEGSDAADVFDLARAVDLVATQEARLLNLSLTGPPNAVLAAAIAGIQARGTLVIAAAGNQGPRAAPLYPAALPGVIAVTAIDGTGQPWRRSARGDHIAFSAEGVNIALAGRDGGAEPYTGTSFAAPVVTAMLAGKLGTARTDALTERLAAIARDSGEPGRDPVFGFGIVRPEDACR
jgi:subtilisin family serine protease